MKKFLSMAAFALMAISLTGCGDDEEPTPNTPTPPTPDGPTQLATPAPAVDASTVTTSGFTVTWPVVANAASYKYTINDGAAQSAAINSASISGLEASTTYTIKVQAISGDTSKYTDSAWGTTTVTTAAAGGGGGNTGELHPSLQGSNYYLIQLDAVTYEKIKDKVVADFRPDDTTRFLYWWNEPAFGDNPAVGPNFYGEAGMGWISMSVAPFNAESMTWFGAGFFCSDKTPLMKLIDLNENYQDYYMHMAWRTTCVGSYGVKLYDGVIDGLELIVNADANANGFTRDGEWQEVEVPMSYFFDKGLFYREANIMGNDGKGLNVMAITQSSDGSWPTEINLDACFIYKK